MTSEEIDACEADAKRLNFGSFGHEVLAWQHVLALAAECKRLQADLEMQTRATASYACDLHRARAEADRLKTEYDTWRDEIKNCIEQERAVFAAGQAVTAELRAKVTELTQRRERTVRQLTRITETSDLATAKCIARIDRDGVVYDEPEEEVRNRGSLMRGEGDME